MDHRPDLAQERSDQRVVEINKNKNIIPRLTGIFHVGIITYQLASCIGGARHQGFGEFEIGHTRNGFVIRTDRQMQIAFFRRRGRIIILEQGHLPLLRCLVYGSETDIVLLCLETVTQAIRCPIIILVPIRAGGIS